MRHIHYVRLLGALLEIKLAIGQSCDIRGTAARLDLDTRHLARDPEPRYAAPRQVRGSCIMNQSSLS